MDGNLQAFESIVKQEGQTALSIHVVDDRSRQEATNWLVKLRSTRKKIEAASMPPIKRMREDLKRMQAFVEGLTAPLKQGEVHINQQIGQFVFAEKEAARRLQEEENARVAALQRQHDEEERQKREAAIQAGVPEHEIPASLAPLVLPEVIVGEPTTTVADTGESVSVRMLSTFNVGNSIVDGKPVDGADLTQENPDFKNLPSYLFEINPTKLRAFVKAGQLKGTMVHTYKKPSTTMRGL